MICVNTAQSGAGLVNVKIMTTAQGIRTEFPGWQAWRGPSGLFYARRLMTSPPTVLRAETIEGLREQVAAYAVAKERQ